MQDFSALDAAQALLACALEKLASTPGGTPGAACAVWGDAVFANCCAGQLTVQVNRVYRSRAFPNAAIEAAQCGELMRVADLSVIVLRCAPQVDEQGRFQSCEQMTAHAAIADADADAIERAVACCFLNMEPAPLWAVGDRDVVTTQGICSGTALNVFVELEGLCCGS